MKNSECKKLSDAEKNILSMYYNLAESLSELFGSGCEIAVHTFENMDTSLTKIVNGHNTNRKLGSPITDMGLKLLADYKKDSTSVSKTYFSKHDEKVFKSSSNLILGDNKRAIGMLCVNYNLSCPFHEVLNSFLPSFEFYHQQNTEFFGTKPVEVILRSLDEAIKKVDENCSITCKMRNKAIVKDIYDAGLFELKEAVTTVAEKLGLTKHAVYKFLREFKNNPDMAIPHCRQFSNKSGEAELVEITRANGKKSLQFVD